MMKDSRVNPRDANATHLASRRTSSSLTDGVRSPRGAGLSTHVIQAVKIVNAIIHLIDKDWGTKTSQVVRKSVKGTSSKILLTSDAVLDDNGPSIASMMRTMSQPASVTSTLFSKSKTLQTRTGKISITPELLFLNTALNQRPPLE